MFRNNAENKIRKGMKMSEISNNDGELTPEQRAMADAVEKTWTTEGFVKCNGSKSYIELITGEKLEGGVLVGPDSPQSDKSSSYSGIGHKSVTQTPGSVKSAIFSNAHNSTHVSGSDK
jgi:hypothetical protein